MKINENEFLKSKKIEIYNLIVELVNNSPNKQ